MRPFGAAGGAAAMTRGTHVFLGILLGNCFFPLCCATLQCTCFNTIRLTCTLLTGRGRDNHTDLCFVCSAISSLTSSNVEFETLKVQCVAFGLIYVFLYWLKLDLVPINTFIKVDIRSTTTIKHIEQESCS